jgi:hypothetical protein
MTLGATATRAEIARGATFTADAQEARDLVRMGRAEIVEDEGKPAAKAGK